MVWRAQSGLWQAMQTALAIALMQVAHFILRVVVERCFAKFQLMLSVLAL